MTKAEAKAEVFWLAFQALSKEEQAKVLSLIMGNRSLREDIIDIAIALERSKKTRPLKDILAEIGEER
jgi:hypothetical protein